MHVCYIKIDGGMMVLYMKIRSVLARCSVQLVVEQSV